FIQHTLDFIVSFIMLTPDRYSTLFPYTTLFRSKSKGNEDRDKVSLAIVDSDDSINQADEEEATYGPIIPGEYNIEATITNDLGKDRKSTRLNSSHVSISYAVFCLKKKIYKTLVY